MDYWIIGFIALGAIVGVVWISSLSRGEDKGPQSPPKRNATPSKSGGDNWQELTIDWKHLGSDWVYLPKFDKDNECKLICIRDMGHREAVKPLIERIVGGREYSLALEREPANEYDPNAIRVVDTTTDPAVPVGYLPRDVSATISERYSVEMPIAVMVKRAIKSPDGEVFLRLAPLVPKKSLRKKFELDQA